MNTTKYRFIGALLAGALLAGCGGGGGAKTSALPISAATATPGGGSTTQSGTRLTFSFSRAKKAGRKTAAATRKVRAGVTRGHAIKSAAAKRQPKYLSDSAEGLQITSTSASGTATLYYDISESSYNCSYNATTYVETCAITIPAPTTGATQTISAIEVDQTPTQENTATGLGNGFPSYSGVLAVGSATSTTTPGALTTVPLSLNPVYANTGDCGDQLDPFSSGNNLGLDNQNYGAERLVVTAGVASDGLLRAYGPGDFDGDCIFADNTDGPDTRTISGQLFVDVNGSPVPATATSSTGHFTFAVSPANASTPAPTTYGTMQSMSGSGYLDGYDDDFATYFQYDGGTTTPDTLTYSNNLTATPPPFTGTGSPSNPTPATYAFSYVYTIVPISASPATLTFSSTAPQTVTGSDVGETYTMDADTNCSTGDGTTIAQTSYISGDQYLVTPVSAGTCTFHLYDDWTQVQTNPITVTVSPGYND